MGGPDFSGQNVQAGTLAVQKEDATSDAPVTVATFAKAVSGGAGANGVGSKIELLAEDDQGGSRTAASIAGVLTDASGAAPKGALQLNSRNTTGAILITDDGKVGIGIAGPEDKLHIVGNLRISGTNKWQFEPDTGYGLALTDRVNDVTKLDIAPGSSGDILLNPSGGKVGIGLTSLGNYKLDVNGDVNVPGTVSGGVPSYGYRRNGALLGRGLTVVVAANDATPAEKAGADYICDASADDVEIQAAINAVFASTAGRGTVQLTSGTFVFTAGTPIRLTEGTGTGGSWAETTLQVDSAKTVHLRGVGKNATIIQSGGTSGDTVQIGHNAGLLKESWLTLSDLTIQATGAKTSGSAIHIQRAWGFQVFNVNIDRTSSNYFDEGIRIDNLATTAAGGYGLLKDIDIRSIRPVYGNGVYVNGGVGSIGRFENVQVNNANTEEPASGFILIDAQGLELDHCGTTECVIGVAITPGTIHTVTASQSGSTVTATAGTFSTADVGRPIWWAAAGVADTVVSYVSATQVTVSISTTRSSQSVDVGGNMVEHIFISGGAYDSYTDKGIKVTPTGLGTVEKLYLTDVWIANATDYAIYMKALASNHIWHTRISGCQTVNAGNGIYLEGGGALTLVGVLIEGCLFRELGGGGYGIRVQDYCERLQILDNHLSRAIGSTVAYGISVYSGASGNTTWILIANNLVDAGAGTTNFTGLYIDDDVTNILHYGNQFRNCNTDVSGQGTANKNYMSSPVYLRPVGGANEGGQVNFVGAGTYTTEMYLDRVQDTIRAVSGSSDLLTIASNGDVVVSGKLTVNDNQTGATKHVFDAYDDVDLLRRWRRGEALPFATGDLLNRDHLLRDSIIQLEARLARLEAKM